jgi:hypothetical protein
MIEKESYTYGPTRVRQKVRGFMWEAEKQILLKNGKVVQFNMWKHFFEDDGSDEWEPMEAEVRENLFCKFVPFGEQLLYAPGHLVLCDGKYYAINTGLFEYNNRNEVVKQIKDESWIENKSIELIC